MFPQKHLRIDPPAVAPWARVRPLIVAPLVLAAAIATPFGRVIAGTTKSRTVEGAFVIGPDAAGQAVNPLLSPDANTVVYEVTYPQEKYTELWSVDVTGTRAERIRPSLSATTLTGRGGDRKQVNHEFAWSARGDLYAYASSGGDEEFDIWIASVSVPIGGDQKEGGVTFSPDNRTIVYCSARTGEGDLYLHDLYTLEKPPQRLTSREDGLEFYASFAPDGKRLAYVAMGEAGATIRVIDDVARAAKTDREAARLDGSSLKPSISPDGKWIGFYSNADNEDRTRFDLWLVPAAGGKPFRAARGVLPAERHGPAWWPDSSALVFVQADPNLGDPLMRLDLATLRAEVLPTGTVNNSDPDIRKDPRTGKVRLVFASQGVRSSETQGWRRIWAIDLGGSR